MADNLTNLTPKKRARRAGPMSAKRRQEAQEAFLTAYAQTGIITSAAQSANVSRQCVYEWQEHDEAFSLRFHEAEATANDVLRAEIFRRGHEGVEEPVYQLAKFVGTVRKYSDTLLIFEAKRRMPEYRDKHDVNISGSLEVKKAADEFDALLDSLIERSATARPQDPAI